MSLSQGIQKFHAPIFLYSFVSKFFKILFHTFFTTNLIKGNAQKRLFSML